VPREEPLRARPVVPRRRRVRPQAARGLPRPRRGQAPPRARHARARALRGGQGRALAAAAGRAPVREAGDQEARQAGGPHRGRPHRHSAGPACARRRVGVALGAFDVTVCDASTGEVVATHGREWGEAPTDGSDPTLRPGLLCARPAGRRDPSAGASLPAEPVSFLDAEAPAGLAAGPGVLRDEGAGRGWPAAVEGMPRSLAATGGVDRASVAPSAARAAAGDGRVEYGEGVGLGACDGAPGLPGGGGRRAADELGARRRPGVLPRRRQGAPRIGRHHRRLPRLRDARAGRGVHVDARVRGRAPRPGAEGAAARAGEVPRAEVGRGLRLVERLVPGRPGPRGHVLPGVRARRRGPRVLRPDGAREDPHGHRARDRRDLGRLPRGVLADGPAGAAAGQGQEGGDARQAARRRCQGEAAGPGRVRPRALRRGRGEAAVPGDIREPREGGA
jgi:hypothetical protein